MISKLFSLPVVVTEHAMVSRWVFPSHRFVEYVQEDEWWARKYGFGYEVFEPGVYQIDSILYVHPKVWASLREHVQEL